MGIARKLVAVLKASNRSRGNCEKKIHFGHCIPRSETPNAGIFETSLLRKSKRIAHVPLGSSTLAGRSFASQAQVFDDDEEFPVRSKDKEVESVAAQLVKTIIGSGKTTKAVDTIKEWQAKGNALTRPLIDIVVSKLVRNSQFQMAIEVLDWMREEKPVEGKETDKYLQLAVACKATDLKRMKELVDALEPSEKTEKVYSHLIIAYADKSKRKEAETTLDLLKENFKPTNPDVFNHMMLMYVRHGEPEKAVEMYSEMKQLGVKPSFHTYHILLRIKEKLGDLEEEIKKNAKAVMKSMDPEKVHRATAHMMLSMYGFLGDGKGVEKLWESLKTFKLREHQAENVGIQAFEMVGRADKVEEIFRESKNPEKLHYHMIRFYVSQGNLEKAKELLPKDTGDVKRGCQHFIPLVVGYVKQKQLNEAFEIVKLCADASRDYHTPEFYPAMESVMNAYAENKDVKGAEDVMSVCIEKKFVRDAKLFNELLKVYVSAQRPVWRFKERMEKENVQPDEQTETLLKLLKA